MLTETSQKSDLPKLLERSSIESSLLTPKNLICNFRAPTLEEFLDWKEYVQVVKNQGLDVCRVTLGLTKAYKEGIKKAVSVKGSEQVVNIQMNNQFLYQVKHPHREPYSLNCVKPEFRRTFSSLLFEAYVLEKARHLEREFSFRDFLELKHDAFRRITVRLRRKGKIVANPQRTIPRFYILTEKLEEYGLNAGTTL